MLIKCTKERFVNIILEMESIEKITLFFTVKDSGIDMGNGFQGKTYTYLYLGSSHAFSFKKTFDYSDFSDVEAAGKDYVNELPVRMVELRSISSENGELVLKEFD